MRNSLSVDLYASETARFLHPFELITKDLLFTDSDCFHSHDLIVKSRLGERHQTHLIIIKYSISSTNLSSSLDVSAYFRFLNGELTFENQSVADVLNNRKTGALKSSDGA